MPLGTRQGCVGSRGQRKAAASDAVHADPDTETAAAAAAADAAAMDDDEIAECVKTFNTFDYDNDGRISLKELGNIMRCLGYGFSRGELKQVFASVDKNQNGFIDLHEFLGIVCRKQVKQRLETDKQLARAFRVFDADKDGFISPAELRAALRRLMRPAEVTDHLVDDMIRGADDDGDGRVSYAEFVGIVTMR